MVFSVGLILVFGLAGSMLFRRMHLPGIMGAMLAGAVIGPYVLDLLDGGFLPFSGDIRVLAFVIILLRAGLMLDISVLRRVGRPALLLCFVPATLEILAYFLFAPAILGVSRVEAGILGAIMGAVSPAVVVPRMTWLMEEGWGTDKGIPQMIIAGASADDVYTIVLFEVLLSMEGGDGIRPEILARIPVSILTGAALGCGIGFMAALLFERLRMQSMQRCLMLLALAILFIALEDTVNAIVPFSGYLAVIGMGMAVLAWRPENARHAAKALSKAWTGAEIFLFVLVGAAIDPSAILQAGLPLVGMIFIGLAFRMLGAWLCVVKTTLKARERLFVMLAELPKATVQAAIGGIPLAMGLNCGTLVLSAAALAIFITAPLGAMAMDISYSLCLQNKHMKGAVIGMKLVNNVRIRLNPILALHGYCAVFEDEEGAYDCEICVHLGNVQLTHACYNVVTGGWDEMPEAKLTLHAGEVRRFHFSNVVHEGGMDSVVVANCAYLKPAEFTMKYERLGEA